VGSFSETRNDWLSRVAGGLNRKNKAFVMESGNEWREIKSRAKQKVVAPIGVKEVLGMIDMHVLLRVLNIILLVLFGRI